MHPATDTTSSALCPFHPRRKDKHACLFFDIVLGNQLAACWDWDVAEGRVHFSRGFATLLGRGNEDLSLDMEDPWTGILLPDDLPMMRGLFTRHVRSGGESPVQSEVRLLKADGALLWVIIRARVVEWSEENKQPLRVAGMVVDITQQKQAEERLAASEEVVRLFVKHAPVAIAMFDLDMRFIMTSQRWMDDFKLSESIIGYSHYEIFPDIPERWKVVHQRCLHGEVMRSEEDCYDRGELGKQWLRWEVRPWFQKNRIGGIVIMAEDITDRKEDEYKLLDTIDSLQQRNRQLRDFAYITSHNLRGPAANILSLIEMYEEEPSPEMAEFVLSNLKPVSGALMSTIDAVNNMVEISTSDIPIELIEIAPVVDRIGKIFSSHLKMVGATIETNLEAAEVPFCHPYLESVLSSLLSNAIRYRSPNRPLIVKILSRALETGEVVISVTDNGLGIDVERYSDRIFGLMQVFHRNPEARGIGLFLCKAQVEAVGGRIEVHSKPDIGSEFKITFRTLQ